MLLYAKRWTCGNYVHGDVFVHDIGRNMFCVVGEFEGYFFLGGDVVC